MSVEVRIRPVIPENAPMALRIALHALRQLIQRSLTPAQFESTTLTVDDVNRAIRQHLSADHLHVVVITKDAAGLRERLLADRPATITDDAPRPPALVAGDRRIGAMRLNLQPAAVTITAVDRVFAN